MKGFNSAYAQWNHDPNWEHHPERYSAYSMDRFMTDWGPKSSYGKITSHRIVMSKTFGNGVVVGVEINGSKTPLFLFVDRQTKQISFSPAQFRLGIGHL